MPLGYAYLSGKGVSPDIGKAADLFEKAAAAKVEGASGGLVSVGYAYQSGNGVAKDPTKAVALLQRAVDAGVDAALLPLGFAYLGAMGVDKDLDKATALFEQAADAKVEGAGGALIAAGYGYQSLGTPEAMKTALVVFQHAVDAGEPKSLNSHGLRLPGR